MGYKAYYYFLRAAVIIVPLIVFGCLAPPTAHVIRPLNELKPHEGLRPRLYLTYRPFSYADHQIYVKTPAGRAFIDIGGALAGSYKEGLGGFFRLVRDPRYGNYRARMDFDQIKSQVEYTVDESGENLLVSVRLEHKIYIHYIFDNSVEEIVSVEVRASKVIPDGDAEHFARQTAIVIQEMLPQLEGNISKWLVRTDHEGKYLIGR
jgi:hypothetical protein